MTRSFHDELTGLLDEANDSMVAIRHDLHAHPELAFEEHRTTKVVRDRLNALGWELTRCPTDTGAVAVLKGGLAGKRVMVRADIDALPVLEERALSYASVNEGVMHACGHDVHTAALLGVAEVLSKRQPIWPASTHFFSSPLKRVGWGSRHDRGGVLDEHPVDFVIGRTSRPLRRSGLSEPAQAYS